MTIGEKIKSERLKKGLSQERLASLAGCTGRAIGYWETGQRCPRMNEVKNIATVLNKHIIYFVVGVDW